MSEELVRAARLIAPMSEEREYIKALCDALDEANERIRELEEQVRTYMEFPYTVPKQR